MFTADDLLDHLTQRVDLAELSAAGVNLGDLVEPWQKRDFFAPLLVSDQFRDRLLDYKLPPLELAPYSDRDLTYVVESGLKNALLISDTVNKYADASAEKLKVLDFGCGSARLSRFFVQFSPDHDYYGCDVNAAAIDFLRENLPGTWDVIQPQPPTAYPDSSFDVVYAWSIFTHYSEPLHLAWLAELHRILKPNGLLLVTVHAPELLYEPHGEVMRIPPGTQDNFKQNQFCYWPFYQDRANREEFGIVDDFGIAFFSHDYIKATWTEQFELLDIETAVVGWQELVTLRQI